MTVPDGHQLKLYRPVQSTSLISTDAVVWLAHVGGRTDEEAEQLDDLIARIDALLSGGRPRILLATARRLSELMAPHDPQVAAHPHGMLLWTVDVAGLVGAPDAPALIQRWLRCLHVHATSNAPPTQCVFLPEIASLQARALSGLVRGLGLEVRVTSPEHPAVLAEVLRPERIALVGLLGAPTASAAHPADPFAREINQVKDRAQRDGDDARLQQLEAEERDALSRRIPPGEPRVSPVRHAPRLRRRLLAVADDGAPAVRALFDELLRRAVPLQVLVNPETMGASLRTWPGDLVALPVFADEASLLVTARGLGMQPGTFAGAVMTPLKLLEWAADQSWALAMYVYRAADRPVSVLVPSDAVKALARGTMPVGPATWPSTVETLLCDNVAVSSRYTYGPDEDIDAVIATIPPASAHMVDLYHPMTGLVAVIVEVTIVPKPRSGTPSFVTTFRLPSGAELRKPWKGAAAPSAEFSRAVLTVPVGAHHVSTTLRA
jgi:hypothetical protein